MSNTEWCDVHNKTPKLLDFSHILKCKYQKQITFTPKQFQLEEAGFKNKVEKTFKGTQTAWNKSPRLRQQLPLLEWLRLQNQRTLW